MRLRTFVKITVSFIAFALWLFITGHIGLVGAAVISGSSLVPAVIHGVHREPRKPKDHPPVDYDKLNRLEFELGIPFSSRPDPFRRPEVYGVGGSYDVVCRGCGYTSIGHLTEAGAQERADSHHREHLTGEVADG
jgi:hypothetical protein